MDNYQTRSLIIIIVFILLKVEFYQVQLGMHPFRNHLNCLGLAEYDKLRIKEIRFYETKNTDVDVKELIKIFYMRKKLLNVFIPTIIYKCISSLKY